MTLIRSLKRIIIYVEDMAQQVHFYHELLGIPLASPPMDDYAGAYWVELETGQARVTLHGGGQKRLGEDSPTMSFLVEDDLDEVRAALIAKGVTLGEIRQPAPGIRVCDGRDPEGNRFSLDWAAHE